MYGPCGFRRARLAQGLRADARLLSAAAARRPFFLGGVVDFVDDAMAAVYTPRRVDAMMRLMTHVCVFENTHPPPDGRRYVGQAAVRAFWETFFRTSREPRIEVEEIFALGESCVMRWTYRWVDAPGRPGHVRGVDIYTMRDGQIAEKLSYVKG